MSKSSKYANSYLLLFFQMVQSLLEDWFVFFHSAISSTFSIEDILVAYRNINFSKTDSDVKFDCEMMIYE